MIGRAKKGEVRCYYMIGATCTPNFYFLFFIQGKNFTCRMTIMIGVCCDKYFFFKEIKKKIGPC